MIGILLIALWFGMIIGMSYYKSHLDRERQASVLRAPVNDNDENNNQRDDLGIEGSSDSDDDDLY